jgi:hypothetical protein
MSRHASTSEMLQALEQSKLDESIACSHLRILRTETYSTRVQWMGGGTDVSCPGTTLAHTLSLGTVAGTSSRRLWWLPPHLLVLAVEVNRSAAALAETGYSLEEVAIS